MNHSIHSADRATHLKIVVVALVAGIAVAGFGISARSNSDYTQTAHVVKAGKADHGDQFGRSSRPLAKIRDFNQTAASRGGLLFSVMLKKEPALSL